MPGLYNHAELVPGIRSMKKITEFLEESSLF